VWPRGLCVHLGNAMRTLSRAYPPQIAGPANQVSVERRLAASPARYPISVSDVRNKNSEQERIGLCVDCRHARRIESARGSVFYLCQRFATNPSFPKYPRLPVIECRGYELKVYNPSAENAT
jgi:hypothetical protein